MSFKRQIVYLGAMILLLAVFSLWSWSVMADSRSQALAAGRELVAAKGSLARMDNLRRKPSMAGSSELALTELTRRIDKAATTAGFAQGALQRIVPESDYRPGDSVYKEKPTAVAIKNVTMQQLVSFLYALCADGSGLELRKLQIAAPRDNENADKWTVDLTVAYLLYSPPTETPGSSAGL
jgi:hypothetical protein